MTSGLGHHDRIGPPVLNGHRRPLEKNTVNGPSDNFRDLSVDHVEFYVADAARSAGDLVGRFGFTVCAVSGNPDRDHYSVGLRQNAIDVVLTQADQEDHPAATFVQRHGDGVANIALRTDDVRRDFTAAVARGARPISEPVEWPDGEITATIGSFGDLRHTLIQRPTRPAATALPGLPDLVAPTDQPMTTIPTGAKPGLLDIDHFAVCLESGTLQSTVEFYESVLDFRVIFEERIVVGAQAMISQVVQSASRAVTLTLIQPDPTTEAGQIDDFIKDHGGPGIQHVAFGSAAIVSSISALRANGVEFLQTPAAYYRLLADRLDLTRYDVNDLRQLDILVDSDHDGQLFQIFARSVHPRRTFFFEVIERFGAQTFGSGNIKALYEAVEAERIRSQDRI